MPRGRLTTSTMRWCSRSFRTTTIATSHVVALRRQAAGWPSLRRVRVPDWLRLCHWWLPSTAPWTALCLIKGGCGSWWRVFGPRLMSTSASNSRGVSYRTHLHPSLPSTTPLSPIARGITQAARALALPLTHRSSHSYALRTSNNASQLSQSSQLSQFRVYVNKSFNNVPTCLS